MLTAIPASDLRRIPPEMQDAVLHRGEWTLCAMEHSVIGSVHLTDPGAPFHHLGLSMSHAPVRVGMSGDGRPLRTTTTRGDIGMIEAGVGGTSWWDGVYESACFYFTDASLAVALGEDVGRDLHSVRSGLAYRSPRLRRLLEALQMDAAAGQPHGTMVGDAIFVTVAALLVARPDDRTGWTRPGTTDWRVRRALEYIHAHLHDSLTIPGIAASAGTSAFHLSRQFRTVMGVSLWRYVLRERARAAVALLHDPGLTLTEVSAVVGFDTYASFIDATRREFGATPSRLRSALSAGDKPSPVRQAI